MPTIKEAIKEFCEKRLAVYSADHNQIVRDTRAADRAAKDHVGRWLFELLQNSEDATAPNIQISIKDDAVYVADNGLGLKPEAVESICGTDFSDKTTGTIGRKGVGFKSVYEVSSNPQVLTVNGEGIEFSPDRAQAWLRQNGFDDGHVPYQWIPFFVSWDEARQQDSTLDSLADYKTVVRLRGVSPDRMRKVEQLLKEWPPHALFAFRYIRKITAPHLKVVLTPGNKVWKLNDSRGKTPASWLVASDPEPEHVPEELLEPLGTDERKAIQENGVSFLIAAPLEEDCAVPTSEYLPVHVFYPTEQNGPVRLLLHAEFLVKSDRTALISIDDSPFNTWVANKLACRICQFVNNAYRLETPSSHAALLAPFEDRESHLVTEVLWEHVAEVAKTDVRLADVESVQCLTIGEASLISVTVRHDLARKLLEATDVRGKLLHYSFDEDKGARKALKELGCEEIRDHGVIEVISENAASRATDTRWIWGCWEWLASWIGKEPYGDKRRERIKHVKGLSVVPVGGRLLKPSELVGRIVTWKPDGQTENLPDWLPLTFVDEWFRNSIQDLTKQVPAIKELCEELGIKEPGADIVQRAVGQAIEQYWKEKLGDPSRFLAFILEQDWHETSNASSALQRCPVPLSRSLQDEEWIEARKAYFGRDWGNELIADLYEGIETVAWVRYDGTEEAQRKHRRVLEWLGIADCPRIVKESKETYYWQLSDDYGEWKKYLEKERDTFGRRVERISVISRIDYLSVTELNREQAGHLVRLIAKHWNGYYRNEMKIIAEGKQGRERDYRSWPVKAKWWLEVCESLVLPVYGSFAEPISLTKCWLPDKRTERAIGDLLPVIDLDTFGNDKDIVHDWLVVSVGLRTQIEQVTVEEWKEFLSTRIPGVAHAERAASHERLRDKVTRWYAVCLETVADQNNISEKAFTASPLLCRKRDSWQYINDEPRYLDDDNEIGKAFDNDVWLFHVPSRLTADAVRYFDVLPLSKSVRIHVEPGEPQSSLESELQARFNDSLPYIWAWRSSRSKQDSDRLSSHLKRMKVHVVPALKAHLDLNGVVHVIERHWNATDDVILLHADHANEDALAQALAKAVDVISEADFYENLLRCNNTSQRKEKLISKGISDAEVERCLREYSGAPEGEELDIVEPTKSVIKVPPFPPSPTPIVKPVPPVEPTPAGKPFCLKDPLAGDYVVIDPLEIEPPPGGGGGGSGGGEVHPLTENEKAKLEEAGRSVAARELEKIGYAVEKMSANHPGFDLRGRRDNEELRVEVKAHMGRATVADVTQRQYKEYLGQQGYQWELWNVEHLATQDVQPVAITRYDDIPDDALEARTFRVDLKKCRSPAKPQ